MRRLAILAFALLAACSSDDPKEPTPQGCVAGQSIECTCPGGGKSAQTCLPDGSGYQTCQCQAVGAGGAGGSAGAAGAAGASGLSGSGGRPQFSDAGCVRSPSDDDPGCAATTFQGAVAYVCSGTPSGLAPLQCMSTGPKPQLFCCKP